MKDCTVCHLKNRERMTHPNPNPVKLPATKNNDVTSLSLDGANIVIKRLFKNIVSSISSSSSNSSKSNNNEI